MEQFAEWEISGSFARSVFENLPQDGSGWRRVPSDEHRAGRTVECFAVETPLGAPPRASRIYFHARGKDRFFVANVVPVGNDRQTASEYNQILYDFYKDVFAQHEMRSDLDVAPPRGIRDLSEFLDQTGVSMISSISNNMSTGVSHPLDFRRWARFVCYTFKTNQVLSDDILRAGLIEEGGWHEEGADELVGMYSQFIDLLRVYEEMRPESLGD